MSSKNRIHFGLSGKFILDTGQNSYNGNLACAPISLLFAGLCLRQGLVEDVLVASMEYGSQIWNRWLTDGKNNFSDVMSLSDILPYYPNIFNLCDMDEYGGVSLYDLSMFINEGKRIDGTCGMITIMSRTNMHDMCHFSIGYSYGLYFYDDYIYIFDSHGDNACLIKCQNVEEMLLNVYKEKVETILYSGLLFHKTV